MKGRNGTSSGSGRGYRSSPEYSLSPLYQAKAASPLVILLGWFHLACANELIIGETKAELSNIHNDSLDLNAIPKIISRGLKKVHMDLERLSG